MIDTVKDMSILTTIPEKTLYKFYRRLIYCICDGIEDSVIAGDTNISAFNIGIGVLYIKHDDAANVKYHFEPSDLFSKCMTQTIVNHKNALEDILTETLGKKFTEVYKDLC